MTSESNGSEWFDDYSDDEEEIGAIDYDLSVTPNDFNVLTLFSFIDSGAIVIPGFQRHYVWDITRASKLIESLILGLPVPQLFLYEEDRNRFLVIDGQQRLMSIYYFIKERFPRKESRPKLRKVFAEKGSLPESILRDDAYFTDFRLSLPKNVPGQRNPYAGSSYSTLGDYKRRLDFRPIRNVVVRPNSPKDDDASVYEIFSRLNSGGVNLTSQEIRNSLYHSEFYDMLRMLNDDTRWRRILGVNEPTLNQKDIEVLLRICAMLVDSDIYAPSMVRFLNQFSRKCQKQDPQKNEYLKCLLGSFFDAAKDLPADAFINKTTNRFNIALVEAVFNAACSKAFLQRRTLSGQLDSRALHALEVDEEFVNAASRATTQTSNVRTRLERGKHFIEAL